MTTISFSLTLIMLIITIIGMLMAINNLFNKIGLANSVLFLDKNKINKRNEQILKLVRNYVSGDILSSLLNINHSVNGAKMWAYIGKE